MTPRPLDAKVRANLRAIMDSPTYRKAYDDAEFMDREELRPVRLQLELLKTEMALTELDIRSTIVVFGSARIKSPEEAHARVAELERQCRAAPQDRRLAETLAAAQRLLSRSR
ncbi:MAG: 3-isopropylmalate dehydrogenase, partial [Elusimicrobia bacterium]|nr:3-isopropylmalate dehydrogenase [Elusimicrobiota bacterium]